MGTEGNINLIEKVKPEALIGIPTFVYHVIREAHAQGRAACTTRRRDFGGCKGRIRGGSHGERKRDVVPDRQRKLFQLRNWRPDHKVRGE